MLVDGLEPGTVRVSQERMGDFLGFSTIGLWLLIRYSLSTLAFFYQGVYCLTSYEVDYALWYGYFVRWEPAEH